MRVCVEREWGGRDGRHRGGREERWIGKGHRSGGRDWGREESEGEKDGGEWEVRDQGRKVLDASLMVLISRIG